MKLILPVCGNGPIHTAVMCRALSQVQTSFYVKRCYQCVVYGSVKSLPADLSPVTPAPEQSSPAASLTSAVKEGRE